MFDYVLNDTVGAKPLVFPEEDLLSDGLVYDPESNVLYDPRVDDHDGEYEYQWSQDKWSSSVDVFTLGKADRRFVLVAGDKMTGGLKMGEDIQVHPSVSNVIFKPKRFGLEENPKLPALEIKILKNHTIAGDQKVGTTLVVGSNAKVKNGNNIRYITNWYRLHPDDFTWMDTIGGGEYDGIVNVPDESDWANMRLVKNDSNSYLLKMEDNHCYFRTEQICVEQNPDDPANPPPDVSSITDTSLIVMPWGSQPRP